LSHDGTCEGFRVGVGVNEADPVRWLIVAVASTSYQAPPLADEGAADCLLSVLIEGDAARWIERGDDRLPQADADCLRGVFNVGVVEVPENHAAEIPKDRLCS